MTPWHSVYRSGTRVSGKRFGPKHPALDVAPNHWGDNAILGQRDGVVVDYGNDIPITQTPGSGSRGIWVRIQHDDGTSVEHCHLAVVPWPVDDRYNPIHVSGDPRGRPVMLGEPTGFFTGLTGDTDGYHDHLIARDAEGNRIDPYPLLFEEEPVPAPEWTPEELDALNRSWAVAEELEAEATVMEADAALRRQEAKAIKNTVRLAKGEPVEAVNE